MALKIIIHSELYKLSASTPNATDPWFAWIGTTGFDAATPPDESHYALLRTWEWDFSKFYFHPGANDDTTGGPRENDTRKFVSTAPLFSGLKTYLDAYIKTVWDSGGAPAFQFNPNERRITGGFGPGAWPNRLRTMANYEDELPQMLNVVRFFRLKDTDLAHKAIFVSPVLTIDGKTYSAPANSKPSGDLTQGSLVLALEGPADFSVELHQGVPTAGAAYSDHKRGWLDLNSTAPNARPWVHEVPATVGRAVSLPSLWLEQKGNSDWTAGELSEYKELVWRAFAPANQLGPQSDGIWSTILKVGPNPPGLPADYEATVKPSSLVENLGKIEGIFDNSDFRKTLGTVLGGALTASLPGDSGREKEAFRTLMNSAAHPSDSDVLAMARAGVDRLESTALITAAQALCVRYALSRSRQWVSFMIERPPVSDFWSHFQDVTLSDANSVAASAQAAVAVESALLGNLAGGHTAEAMSKLIPTTGTVTAGFAGIFYEFFPPKFQPTTPVADPLDRGYVPLLRRVSKTWCCLSQADIIVAGPDADLTAAGLDSLNGAIAARQVPVANNVVQSHWEYRNQPAAAESPDSAYSQARSAKADDYLGSSLPLRYRSPYSTNLVRANFTAGAEVYELAAAAVGVAGNLPWEIADPNRPWRVKLDAAMIPKSVKIPFKRTSRTSEVRIKDLSAAGFALQDKIPFLWHEKERDSTKHKPILLLTQQVKDAWRQQILSYRFDVKAPKVDLDTWLACQDQLTAGQRDFYAKNVGQMKDRADVPDATAEAKRQSVDDEETSFDDTYVIGCEVALTDEDGVPLNGAAFKLSFSSASTQVTVSVDDKNLTVSGNGSFTVAIGGKSLFQLRLTPMLAAGAADRMWDASLAVKWIWLEIARPFSEIADLSRSLLANLADISRTGDRVLSYRVNKPASSTDQLATQFDLIGRVEFTTQRYAWDGRPFRQVQGDGVAPGFPFHQNLRANDPLYFSDRDSAQGKPVPALRQGDVWFSEPQPDALGAEFYRFAATIENRYAPLLTNPQVDSRLKDKQLTEWKWQVLPARIPFGGGKPGRLLPPFVKIVLPLIGEAANASSTSLLVVLGEGALNQLYLAEEVKAEIEKVAFKSVRDESANQPTQLEEQGFAPSRVPLAKDGTTAPQLKLDAAVDGPIGYSADVSGGKQRQRRASYCVTLTAADTSALKTSGGWDGYFVKLRFRRTANGDGIFGFDVKDVESEWTPGIWVQLLNPSNLWLKQTGTNSGAPVLDFCDSTELQFDTSAKTFCTAKDRRPVTLPANQFENSVQRVETWVLLTRSISDAAGQKTEEFVSLTSMAKFSAITHDNHSIFRLVAVQYPKLKIDQKPTTLDELEPLLFPVRGDTQQEYEWEDVRARITQISPPIKAL